MQAETVVFQTATKPARNTLAVIVPKSTTDNKLTKLNDRQEKHFNNYWKHQQKNLQI
jgi:hypothetical protein